MDSLSVGDSSFYKSVRLLSVGVGFRIVLLNNGTDYLTPFFQSNHDFNE